MKNLHHIALATVVVSVVATTATPVRAEGTAELGVNGRVQNSTVLLIDIVTIGERISWRGQGTLTVTPPGGGLPFVLLNNTQSLGLLATGTYSAQMSATQDVANFDITVVTGVGAGTPVDGGRLHSVQWNLAINSRTQATALNHSFYVRVGGGAPDKDAVIDVDFAGLNGNFHRFGMNSTGVSGRTDGRSGDGGSSFAPEFPLYLNPPAVRLGGVLTPTISDLAFFADPDEQSCSVVELGVGGVFKLTTNAIGTAHVVCDLNRDGVLSIVDRADLALVKTTAVGVNEFAWDGNDNAGVDVPTGDYVCEAFVTTGELHFLGEDIETSFPGVRMYDLGEDDVTTTPLRMFWDDALLQPATDVNMPAPLNVPGLVSSSADGMLSSPKADAAVPNTSSRAWGNFDGDGRRGTDEVTDTWTFARVSTRARLDLSVVNGTTDTDGDGLTDVDELCLHSTDPDDDDSDDDGITDGNEVSADTDPNDADSDDDRLQDGTEIGLTAPQGVDTNTDTFVADADPTTTTDPLDSDTDDGSVKDGDEDTNHNGRVDEAETDPEVGADDLLRDGDGDGITDVIETATGTDPDDADSDDDSISDGDEDANHDGIVDAGETDPRDADSDNDGLQDGTELGLTAPGGNTDPAIFIPDADPTTTTDPLDADTDDGSVLDGIEDANHNGRLDDGETDPNIGADDVDGIDTDGDGISDGVEIGTGTNPNDADSDGDGVTDGVEDENHNGSVDDGETDPRDADSDDDGLDDGLEDADHDGGVDDGETDPTNPDTDGDTLKDGDEDENRNGSVDDGETDPRDPDTNNDGICDAPAITIAGVCEPDDGDDDDDGIVDVDDNCPAAANLDQQDDDGDGIGDACDDDADGDGYIDDKIVEGGGITSCSQGDTSASLVALLGALVLGRQKRRRA